MSSPLRPIASTGVALLSAGMIAASPLVPPPTTSALVDFPVELTAIGWDEVLDNTAGNLSLIGQGVVDLFQGNAELVAGPLELVISPVMTTFGVMEAIGDLPERILESVVMVGDSPLAALEGIVNLPAGIVDAFVNGYAGTSPGILGPYGLIDGLVVGVPNAIVNLFTGDFPALGFDSFGEMFSGLLDLPATLLDLPMSLLDGLPGFDWLSGIFSTLLEVLMPF